MTSQKNGVLKKKTPSFVTMKVQYCVHKRPPLDPNAGQNKFRPYLF